MTDDTKGRSNGTGAPGAGAPGAEGPDAGGWRGAGQKSVLLVIGGGVAAFKSLLLIRLLAARGIGTRAILTAAGAEFVTPLSVSALSGEKCYTDLFDLTDEAEMGHIELSRSADLVVVAPATADLMAKATAGLANDLASTMLLATDKQVLFAPAMNVRMWEHPATRRNLDQLRRDGALIVGPDEGDMACGEYGYGRLAEPDVIAGAIEAALIAAPDAALKGAHVVVTAGPTHEPLDPVRYLANRSSGRQGYGIARALAHLGARVTLVSGPVNLPAPPGTDLIRVETARQMLEATQAALPADAAICCAAVADYRPEVETDRKIKKEQGGLAGIPLAENPDILQWLSQQTDQRPRLVVGFAAETDDVLAHAAVKRTRKGCDWIVANDVSPGTGNMGGAQNSVTLLTQTGEEAWRDLPKAEIAARLAARLADFLATA